MVNDRARTPQRAATAPPRTLNVQKFAESRAPELEALHSIVANRLNNDFRSQRNKRRRSTSYDNRISKQKFRKGLKDGVADTRKGDTSIEEKKAPRRVRRRIELKKNPQQGFCTSGDGTKRLRTHVWHAKRFTMSKLWGFHLPFGLQGRGRGSRALLKWLKHGALVHDASYCSAIQLEGSRESLLSVLSNVLMPSPLACPEDISNNLLSGSIYGNAVLHHVGAPCSPAIAPVTYMWRHSLQKDRGGVVEGQCVDLLAEQKDPNTCPSFRQLWIWVHAAAFGEGYDALKSACQRQMEISGHSVDCISLEGQLAQVEVLGSRAFELLQKIIHPSDSVSKKFWSLMPCSRGVDEIKVHPRTSILENEDEIPASSIIAINVFDPRLVRKKEAAPYLETPPTTLLDQMQNDKVLGKMASSEILRTSSSSLNLEVGSDVADLDLWDASRGICPPLEENALCMEKHAKRLAFFGFQEKESGIPGVSNIEQNSRWCPVILLKGNNCKGSVVRWTVVLPLCWLKTFWVPLVATGAHAIGLRERRWISCDVGLPCFPFDFPECNAYMYLMETEAIARHEKEKLRPPSGQPMRVPILPPWHCIRFSLKNLFMKADKFQMQLEESRSENMSYDLGTKVCCQSCDVAVVGSQDMQNDVFVARTSFMLTHVLDSINGHNLLLFPDMPDRKNYIPFMKDESLLSQHPSESALVANYKKFCLLRVCLHVYREGVFQEGAVICAPSIADIELLMGRSNKDRKLQISECSMRSYFVLQPSGKWELNLPDDPATEESFRWPIGFVTNGVVRGSKRPVAVAFCEAVLLACLREEQWRAVPAKKRKKEIYVLVRNLRSTAYRLGLATIVLEQQQHDVEYL